jgi:hypothetical protein
MIVNRIKENKFYILYRRNRGKEKTCPLYAIYRTQEYGGDMVTNKQTLKEAISLFNRATKECVEHEKLMGI